MRGAMRETDKPTDRERKRQRETERRREILRVRTTRMRWGVLRRFWGVCQRGAAVYMHEYSRTAGGCCQYLLVSRIRGVINGPSNRLTM